MNGEARRMNEEMQDTTIGGETPPSIAPGTIMIDIISQYRHTEAIFKHLEEETGACVLCQGLFLSLGEAAEKFGFDLETLLKNLHAVIGGEDGCIREYRGEKRTL